MVKGFKQKTPVSVKFDKSIFSIIIVFITTEWLSKETGVFFGTPCIDPMIGLTWEKVRVVGALLELHHDVKEGDLAAALGVKRLKVPR